MAPDVEVVTHPLIVWADPGLITGVALCDAQGGGFSSAQCEEDDLPRYLHELRKRHGGPMVIGWEAYLTAGGPQDGTAVYSQQAITRLLDFALVYDIPMLKPQPSSARKLGSKVFLRRLGWYKPGKIHANDAAMHLLSHMLRSRPIPPKIRRTLFPGYDPGVTIHP